MTEDVPDWGSVTEPAADPVGLPGNPGFLSPLVPAFAVRDPRGRPVVETPLSPRAQTLYLARLVASAGVLVAPVAGAALTLLAGHLLGSGALPDGRPAPWWLVLALAVVALVPGTLLIGVHTVALAATGSSRVGSRLTAATALLAVALGAGTVVALDRAGVEHHAVQDRLRALRRDGMRTEGRLESVRYHGRWTDDGRPRLDATVTYGTPGAERRVDLLLVAPADRVPLPGAPVVVVHDPADEPTGHGTAPGPGGPGPAAPGGTSRGRWLDDVVLVELDQSRPVAYDPDVAAYARAGAED
ncbi:hypothetical protein L603_000200000980 [Cellulosimicrobium cellulans J34]|nr:hypothetical protein L603_000200000980 [Cellulosimicrobium cellulans J34]